jgi:hypothetical protein
VELPGIPNFCPLIYKISQLEEYIASKFQNQKNTHINSMHNEVMQRAASFLLLKDTKASFTIDYYRYFDATKQAEFLFD